MLDWIDRLRPTVELLIQLGVWFLPHPWINLFLPASRTAAVVEPTLADLTPADTGMGPILLYPFRPGLVRRRSVQTPDEPVAFLFAILRTTVPPTDPAAQVADNRALYDRARAVGGKRCPVGSVPFSPLDLDRPVRPRLPGLRRGQGEVGPTPGARARAGHLRPTALTRAVGLAPPTLPAGPRRRSACGRPAGLGRPAARRCDETRP